MLHLGKHMVQLCLVSGVSGWMLDAIAIARCNITSASATKHVVSYWGHTGETFGQGLVIKKNFK